MLIKSFLSDGTISIHTAHPYRKVLAHLQLKNWTTVSTVVQLYQAITLVRVLRVSTGEFNDGAVHYQYLVDISSITAVVPVLYRSRSRIVDAWTVLNLVRLKYDTSCRSTTAIGISRSVSAICVTYM